jgi:hypothetical protein
MEARLATLERRLRWSHRLLLALCLLLLLSVSLASQPQPSVMPVLRTQRLEVVDAAGQVLLIAEGGAGGGALTLQNAAGKRGVYTAASMRGGLLEVFDAAGQALFSVGLTAGGLEGRWEQTLRTVTHHSQELDRQRRLVDDLTQKRQALRQPSRSAGDSDLQADQLRRDVDQQQRDLDRLTRQVESLARQLQMLERR